jgi:hypothetical protein
MLMTEHVTFLGFRAMNSLLPRAVAVSSTYIAYKCYVTYFHRTADSPPAEPRQVAPTAEDATTPQNQSLSPSAASAAIPISDDDTRLHRTADSPPAEPRQVAPTAEDAMTPQNQSLSPSAASAPTLATQGENNGEQNGAARRHVNN